MRVCKIEEGSASKGLHRGQIITGEMVKKHDIKVKLLLPSGSRGSKTKLVKCYLPSQESLIFSRIEPNTQFMVISLYLANLSMAACSL